MKKIFISMVALFITATTFSQSITLTPALIEKSGDTDDIKLTKFDFEHGGVIIGRNANGSPTSPTASRSGAQLLLLGGRGYNGSSFPTPSNVAIILEASQNWSASARGTKITFATTPNNDISRLTRMIINEDGNVAIGNHFPTAKLHVRGSGFSGVTSNSSVFIEDNTNNYLSLASPNSNETGILFGKPTLGEASGGIIYNSLNNLDLRTGGNNTRMTISSSGNVGIGLTIPEAKLHVDGDFAIKKRTFLSNTTQTINDLDRLSASIISSTVSATLYTTTISGIAGGVDGLILYINPVQNATIILQNENAGSTDINRIISHTAANITISNNGGLTLMYDAIVERWRVISVAN